MATSATNVTEQIKNFFADQEKQITEFLEKLSPEKNKSQPKEFSAEFRQQLSDFLAANIPKTTQALQQAMRNSELASEPTNRQSTETAQVEAAGKELEQIGANFYKLLDLVEHAEKHNIITTDIAITLLKGTQEIEQNLMGCYRKLWQPNEPRLKQLLSHPHSYWLDEKNRSEPLQFKYSLQSKLLNSQVCGPIGKERAKNLVLQLQKSQPQTASQTQSSATDHKHEASPTAIAQTSPQDIVADSKEPQELSFNDWVGLLWHQSSRLEKRLGKAKLLEVYLKKDPSLILATYASTTTTDISDIGSCADKINDQLEKLLQPTFSNGREIHHSSRRFPNSSTEEERLAALKYELNYIVAILGHDTNNLQNKVDYIEKVIAYDGSMGFGFRDRLFVPLYDPKIIQQLLSALTPKFVDVPDSKADAKTEIAVASQDSKAAEISKAQKPADTSPQAITKVLRNGLIASEFAINAFSQVLLNTPIAVLFGEYRALDDLQLIRWFFNNEDTRLNQLQQLLQSARAQLNPVAAQNFEKCIQEQRQALQARLPQLQTKIFTHIKDIVLKASNLEVEYGNDGRPRLHKDKKDVSTENLDSYFPKLKSQLEQLKVEAKQNNSQIGEPPIDEKQVDELQQALTHLQTTLELPRHRHLGKQEREQYRKENFNNLTRSLPAALEKLETSLFLSDLGNDAPNFDMAKKELEKLQTTYSNVQAAIHREKQRFFILSPPNLNFTDELLNPITPEDLCRNNLLSAQINALECRLNLVQVGIQHNLDAQLNLQLSANPSHAAATQIQISEAQAARSKLLLDTFQKLTTALRHFDQAVSSQNQTREGISIAAGIHGQFVSIEKQLCEQLTIHSKLPDAASTPLENKSTAPTVGAPAHTQSQTNRASTDSKRTTPNQTVENSSVLQQQVSPEQIQQLKLEIERVKFNLHLAEMRELTERLQGGPEKMTEDEWADIPFLVKLKMGSFIDAVDMRLMIDGDAITTTTQLVCGDNPTVHLTLAAELVQLTKDKFSDKAASDFFKYIDESLETAKTKWPKLFSPAPLLQTSMPTPTPAENKYGDKVGNANGANRAAVTPGSSSSSTSNGHTNVDAAKVVEEYESNDFSSVAFVANQRLRTPLSEQHKQGSKAWNVVCWVGRQFRDHPARTLFVLGLAAATFFFPPLLAVMGVGSKIAVLAVTLLINSLIFYGLKDKLAGIKLEPQSIGAKFLWYLAVAGLAFVGAYVVGPAVAATLATKFIATWQPVIQAAFAFASVVLITGLTALWNRFSGGAKASTGAKPYADTDARMISHSAVGHKATPDKSHARSPLLALHQQTSNTTDDGHHVGNKHQDRPQPKAGSLASQNVADSGDNSDDNVYACADAFSMKAPLLARGQNAQQAVQSTTLTQGDQRGHDSIDTHSI